MEPIVDQHLHAIVPHFWIHFPIKLHGGKYFIFKKYFLFIEEHQIEGLEKKLKSICNSEVFMIGPRQFLSQ